MPGRLLIIQSLQEIQALKDYIRKPSDCSTLKRCQLVLAYLKGRPIREIQKVWGVSRNTPAKWVNRFNKDGIDGLANLPRSGRKPKCSEDIIHNILNHSPRIHHYSVEGWGIQELKQTLEKRHQVDYSLSGLYSRIRRLNYRHLVPRSTHYKADPRKQRRWSSKVAPALLQTPNQLIIEDETTVNVATQTCRIIAPRGSKPTIKTKIGHYNQRWNVYISYLVAQGKVVVSIKQSLKVNAMKQHLQDVKRAFGKGRINLVLDGSGTHSGAEFDTYCKKKGYHCYYLPPHSPQMNPVEEINRQLKRALKNRLFPDPQALLKAIEQFFQDRDYFFGLDVPKYFRV